MDLLQQELNNNQKNKSPKKTVLAALIFCVILLILIIILMSMVKGTKEVKDIFTVDDKEIDRAILLDNNGELYIPLENAAEIADFKYYNGKYGDNEENKNQCYFQDKNNNEVIGFEVDSKKIYKIDLKGNNEYQYFELKNNVIASEGKLYISLEDYAKACNMSFESENNNMVITMYTKEFLTNFYKDEITGEDKKYKEISSQYNNMKTIAYGMIVINDGVNYGVIDQDDKIVIGSKYIELLFDEETSSFIAKDNNKNCGVITTKGEVKVQFEYEDVEILKYEPLLYKVKQNGKYGIINEDGKEIIKIEYDKLGYALNNDQEILIIENVYNKQDGLIVCKNNKYGIVNLDNGRTILDCTIDKITTKISNNKTVYYVKVGDVTLTLEDYIKEARTEVINL